MKTSIVDVPKKAGAKDLFEIEKYQRGLINFIKNADTPLTIALQGEWGSGKTSLMNSLQEELCGNLEIENLKNHTNDFYGIWLNTWQYSLMNGKEETLMSIIASLSLKIGQIAETRHSSKSDKIVSKLKGLFRKAIVASARYAAEKISDGSSEVIDSMVNADQEITIFHLRNELQETISECIKSDEAKGSPKKGFIFFIDDLDRIDPPVAVQILELLKNIFDLDKCIFVLAIDYDVVVKGLEPKFGKINTKNEREFRSFFDKIIQMPFSMPVTSYIIDEFLKDNLQAIEYFNESEIVVENLLENLKNISMWTVGSNPRSLKRLINSLSLIKCINGNINTDEFKENELLEKVVNFALVGMQISYPSIYNLLVKQSEFNNWDEKIALQLNLEALDENTKEKISKSDEFNDEWEQILYRICEKDIHLQKNALNISRLLNFLIIFCAKNNEPYVGEIIGAVISLSSITNLEHNDKQQIDYHKGTLLKKIRDKIIPLLKSNLPEIKDLIQAQGAKVITNAFIKFTENDNGRVVKLQSHPHSGKIRLIINLEYWFTRTDCEFYKDLTKIGEFDNFEALEKRMQDELTKNKEKIEIYAWNDKDYLYSTGSVHKFWLSNYIVLNSEKEFDMVENIEMICNIITEMYLISVEFDKINAKIKNE